MYHTKNIQRRPISYTSNNLSSKSSNYSTVQKPDRTEKSGTEKFHPRKPLRIYIGDMVQVVDNTSIFFKKFGLVEKVLPHNVDYQAIIKIGKESNYFMFRQLKFCTRIGKDPMVEELHDKHDRDDRYDKIDKIEDYHVPKISDYVDEVDYKDDDIGNR